MKNKIAIAVHGGAGTILRSEMTEEKEETYRKGLADALNFGYQILEKGGSALDAVTFARIKQWKIFQRLYCNGYSFQS